VLAIGLAGIGAATASANTGSQISAPQNVSASVGPGSVTVTWSVPAFLDNKTVTGYDVAYSTNGLVADSNWTTVQVASSARSHTFSGLASSTAYYTQVRAVIDGGQGAWGHPWTLVYKTVNKTRDSTLGSFSYSNTPLDHTRADFTRVRYRIAATSTAGQFSGSFVDADFFRDYTKQASSGSSDYSNLGFLRVPDFGNVFTLQGDVSDLTVTSDSAQVTKGSGLTGRIEIWPRNFPKVWKKIYCNFKG
jgi:hypothetical protein